jgi:hypothetical protein
MSYFDPPPGSAQDARDDLEHAFEERAMLD